MKIIVMDCETDGLVKDATKLHCVAWTEDGETFHHTSEATKICELLLQEDARIVAHNCVRFDMPVLNKLLGLDLKYTKFIDTLALSWYINYDRDRHGLEGFGVDYGVPKPKVTDWSTLTYDEYAHRCVEDVKINWLLWKDLEKKLGALYGWKN